MPRDGIWALVSLGALVSFLGGFLLSRWLSGRRFALDRPNWRSAHTEPVPRSGGVAMCGAFLVGFAVVAVPEGGGGMFGGQMLGVLAAAVVMAVVGLVDDLRSLSPVSKLAAQILAASIAIAGGAVVELVGLPGGEVLRLGWWGPALSALWLLVAMNAVNFLDGADGLVSKSMVAGFLGLAALGLVVGRLDVAIVAMLVGCACWGFYFVNRPPARLFMGDSGSQFLGMMIGGLALAAAPPIEQRLSLAAIPLLFLPILFDAAFTVVRRALALRPVWRPHRTHLFQLALRAGMPPLMLSRLYLGMTIFGLACALAMLATPAPWHQAWLLPPLAVQLIWLAQVARMRRAKNIPWHDDR